ncbi:hypothetical protein E2C01_089689 [Portunus trituberculatus]|uniref:Uncharacterized protein n=1 Tax=Portunus trituberculatus TaxID=210409 RepID=A0A5B7JJR6_PORTR|nr:hypothetical protein [Portunus trituberculatus]
MPPAALGPGPSSHAHARCSASPASPSPNPTLSYPLIYNHEGFQSPAFLYPPDMISSVEEGAFISLSISTCN